MPAAKSSEPTPQPTKSQARYLSFIVAYIDGYGESPAESDIAKALSVSAPSANAMVRKLEALGFITREPGVPRSIAIPKAIPDLPRWRGKLPPRTVAIWAHKDLTKAQLREIVSQIRPANPRSVPSLPSIGNIFTVSMTLLLTDPKVWRRIETPDVSLGRLHRLIQTTMGWRDEHCYQFLTSTGTSRGRRVKLGDEIPDADRLMLSQLVEKKQKRLQYWYDFGDSWIHEIKIEKVAAMDSSATYPRCIGGELACPLESCGGIYGYYDCVEGDHWMLDEFDLEFDAEAFDIDAINQKLSRRRK